MYCYVHVCIHVIIHVCMHTLINTSIRTLPSLLMRPTDAYSDCSESSEESPDTNVRMSYVVIITHIYMCIRVFDKF